MVEATMSYQLPVEGEILVQKGEKVERGDVLGEAQVSPSVKRLNVARSLGVQPQSLAKFLLKKKGESVSAGEVIAAKNQFFGLTKKRFISPLKGIFQGGDEKGFVHLALPKKPVQIKTQVSGQVTKVKKGRGVEIGFQAQEIKGREVMGKGERVWGQIKSFPPGDLSFKSLPPGLEEKILFTLGEIKRSFWEKAMALGVNGLVISRLKKGQRERLKKEVQTSWLKKPLLILEIGKKIEMDKNWEGKRGIIEREKKRLLIVES